MCSSDLTQSRWFTAALAWYFVAIWGSGFVATKTALQYVAPLTFLSIRFALGIMCLIPFLMLSHKIPLCAKGPPLHRNRLQHEFPF